MDSLHQEQESPWQMDSGQVTHTNKNQYHTHIHTSYLVIVTHHIHHHHHPRPNNAVVILVVVVAFWLLGSSISRVNWPRCGEIDIMEQVNGRGTGGQDDSLQFGTLHYNQDGENSTNVNHQQTGATITAKKGQYWGDDFHLYQAIWTSTSFTFLVDDLAYETIDLTKQVSFNSFNDPSNSFFFIVNLALGGNFPKRIPDPNGFPARFELDWIRVWKQEGEGIVHIKQADPASISHEYQEAQQGKVREFQQTQNKATNTNNRHIQQ